MALSQKHRSTIYEHLAPIIGEEEAEAMLSQFPSNDLDVPATKDFVSATAADIRTEIADLRSELRGEIADLRSELRTEIAGLRVEMHAGFAAVSEKFRQQTIWFVSAMASALTVGMAIAAGIGRL